MTPEKIKDSLVQLDTSSLTADHIGKQTLSLGTGIIKQRFKFTKTQEYGKTTFRIVPFLPSKDL